MDVRLYAATNSYHSNQFPIFKLEMLLQTALHMQHLKFRPFADPEKSHLQKLYYKSKQPPTQPLSSI